MNSSENANSSHIDLNQFWDNYGDMKDALPPLITLFCDQTEPALARIRVALDAKDPKALRAAAHRFKGALSQLYASGLAAIALSLEKLGHEGKVEGAEAIFQQLQSGVNELSIQLKNFDYRT